MAWQPRKDSRELSDRLRTRDFLLQHLRHTLSFYDQRAIDPSGGFFHCFMNNGVFDRGLRTLVASCRFVFNYAMAYRQFGSDSTARTSRTGWTTCAACITIRRPAVTPGRSALAAPSRRDQPLLRQALSCWLRLCAQSRHERSQAWIYETFELMESRFWSRKTGLYACEAESDWTLGAYRGQNDNMHACEALICACRRPATRCLWTAPSASPPI